MTPEELIARAVAAGFTVHRPDLFIDVNRDSRGDVYDDVCNKVNGRSGRFMSVQQLDDYDVTQLLAPELEETDSDNLNDTLLVLKPPAVFVPPAGVEDASPAVLFFYDKQD